MDTTWAVAIVKTGHERRIAEKLHHNGIEHFLPLIRRRRSVLPMFPSYIFTGVGLGFRRILVISGVLDFIRLTQGQPSLIGRSVVDEIQSRCDPNGVITIEEDPSRFVVGQKVRVERGPFTGWHGIISRLSEHERVEVLLSIMGRSARVGINENALTAA